MPKFSNTSKSRLKTCHNDLITFASEGIKETPVDFSVVCGRRGREEQETAYAKGYSKALYGQSPHNVEPYSLATDLVPWVDGALVWDAKSEYYKALGEHLMDIADQLYIDNAIENRIEWALEEWGWDAPHWQIRGWKGLR